MNVFKKNFERRILKRENFKKILKDFKRFLFNKKKR